MHMLDNLAAGNHDRFPRDLDRLEGVCEWQWRRLDVVIGDGDASSDG